MTAKTNVRLAIAALLTTTLLATSCAAKYRTDATRVFLSPAQLETLASAKVVTVEGKKHRVVVGNNETPVTIDVDAELVVLTKQRSHRFDDPSEVFVAVDALKFSRGDLEATIPLDRITGVFLEDRREVQVSSSGSRTARAALLTAVIAGGVVGSSLLFLSCCVAFGS